MTSHGHSLRDPHTGKILSRTYNIWRAMKCRCADTTEPGYSKYKGRGITVCERWLYNFPAFLKDMGECPAGKQIDRKDNNKSYSKGNCHWTTAQRNCHNRRSTLFCRYRGSLQPVMVVAQIIGVKYYTLRKRLQHAPHLLSKNFSKVDIDPLGTPLYAAQSKDLVSPWS
jgi:hypothetical protein